MRTRTWCWMAIGSGILLSGVWLGRDFVWAELASYAPKTVAPLPARLLTWEEHDRVRDARPQPWPYVVEVPGKLLCFGASHTRDWDDPQRQHIDAAWQQFKPTVALAESRLGLWLGGDRSAFERFGEPALVGALARQGRVPVYSLEPAWRDEIEALRSQFTAEHLLLFYVLRVWMGERKDVKGREAQDPLAAHLLHKRRKATGLDGIADVAAMDALWQRDFASLPDWRDAPPEVIHPNRGGSVLNRIADASNRVRDEHFARVMLELVQRGERVFAVCGGSHAIRLEPVLRAGTGG